METFFRFSAYNTEVFSAYNTDSCYGLGTEEDASKYCDYLNRNLDIKLFHLEEVEEPRDQIKNEYFVLIEFLEYLKNS